jgi:hypothetical protein
MKKFFFSSLLLAAGLLAVPLLAQAADGEIGNFDNGPDGFVPAAEGPGYNSTHSLRLTNQANGDASTKKVFNAKIFVGYNNLEFDLNLNGATLLGGDASAVAFEQGGWKYVSLSNYAQNGVNGWQHIIIPLSDFPALSQDAGVAWMNIRIWNYKSGSYDFDNIRLTTSNVGGGGNQAIPTPTNLEAKLSAPTTVELRWQGTTSDYKLYRQDESSALTVNGKVFTDSGLNPNAEYFYRVTAIANGQESAPSNVVTIKTASVGGGGNNGGNNGQIYPIANFENGPDGFLPAASGPGYNSAASLKMVNQANGDSATKKVFNAQIFTGMNYLEFDVNLNGAQLMGGDASAVAFEQGGWKYISLNNYVQNGLNGWQHIKIALADFPNLSQNSGVAWMNFRFWNNRTMEILLDNILLTS